MAGCNAENRRTTFRSARCRISNVVTSLRGAGVHTWTQSLPRAIRTRMDRQSGLTYGDKIPCCSNSGPDCLGCCSASSLLCGAVSRLLCGSGICCRPDGAYFWIAIRKNTVKKVDTGFQRSHRRFLTPAARAKPARLVTPRFGLPQRCIHRPGWPGEPENFRLSKNCKTLVDSD